MIAGSRHQACIDWHSLDEAVLIAAARSRDEQAVRELIRRLNPRLFRIARGIVESDAEAEEVVQDCYLTAFTRLAEFRGEARFATWVTRIAINSARMRQRAARPQEEFDTVAESDLSNSVLAFPGQAAERPDAALGRAQVRAMLEAAVGELPEHLRLVFLMREVEGMSVLDVARDLSLNPVTVKTRAYRARRQLRALIEGQLSAGFESIFPFDGRRCAGMAEQVVGALEASGAL